MNRRQYVKTWFLALYAACGGRAWANAVAQPSPHGERGEFYSLGAFVDTLIPAYLGPSGSEAGVPTRLLARAAQDENFRHMLRAGCDWLDHGARRFGIDRFAKLSDDAQIQIVCEAEAAAAASLERKFFERVRHDVFHHYYANAASWPYISHRGPPQPVGYPDYASPPQQ